MVTKSDIEQAMAKAVRGHRGKPEVRDMLQDRDGYRDRLYGDLLSGDYVRHISYRPLERTGAAGCCRRRSIRGCCKYCGASR